MPNYNNRETVNIRPSVGYLSILQAINYRAWYAIAEFVDNSLQSYLHNKPMLRKLHGTNFKLPEYRKKYEYLTKFRIVPLNFGEYDGQKVFDGDVIARLPKETTKT